MTVLLKMQQANLQEREFRKAYAMDLRGMDVNTRNWIDSAQDRVY